MKMLGRKVRHKVYRPWYCCPGHDGTPKSHIRYGARKSMRAAEKRNWKRML